MATKNPKITPEILAGLLNTTGYEHGVESFLDGLYGGTSPFSCNHEDPISNILCEPLVCLWAGDEAKTETNYDRETRERVNSRVNKLLDVQTFFEGAAKAVELTIRRVKAEPYESYKHRNTKKRSQ